MSRVLLLPACKIWAPPSVVQSAYCCVNRRPVLHILECTSHPLVVAQKSQKKFFSFLHGCAFVLLLYVQPCVHERGMHPMIRGCYWWAMSGRGCMHGIMRMHACAV